MIKSNARKVYPEKPKAASSEHTVCHYGNVHASTTCNDGDLDAKAPPGHDATTTTTAATTAAAAAAATTTTTAAAAAGHIKSVHSWHFCAMWTVSYPHNILTTNESASVDVNIA